jgi:outer membrane protein TolC
MKNFISIILLSQLSYAQVIDLEALVNSATQSQKIKEMIEHEFQSKSSKILADVEETSLTFNHTLARSKSPNISGFEHEIGFSKEFKLGNIQELEKKASQLNAEASSIEQEQYLVNINNRIKNAYHAYCLDAQYAYVFEEKQAHFALLYEKKQKAYAEDEIAKTELLQIEFENRKLESSVANFNQKVEDEKEQLLRLGG